MIAKPMFALGFLLLAACATIPAGPTTSRVTPLGTHAGELCNRDRAMIFEDPTGVRVLYDAGTSVLGGDDARLGAVHVVLLSHARRSHGRPAPPARSRPGPASPRRARDRRAQRDERQDCGVEERGTGDDQPDGELPRQARRGDQGPSDGGVPGQRGRR